MKPTEDLYFLIKSLSKGEKIYFKKFSKRHIIGGENKYVKLFDIIDNLSGQYDENTVKINFGKDKFINQIHVAKNYLFELILKSLYEFHSGKKSESVINENLEKIDFLLEKNLKKAAIKLLYKTKEIAKNSFHYEHLYRILETEAYIIAREYSKKATGELDRINIEKNEALEILGNISLYKTLNNKLNILTSKWSYSNDPDFKNKIRGIMEISEVKNELKASDYACRMELYRIKIKAYRFLLDDKNSLLYREKALLLMEQHPEIISKFPEKYISRIYDYINYALGTEAGIKKDIKIENHLWKMKTCLDAVLNSRKSLSVKALNWYYYYQMLIGYNYTTLNKEGFELAIASFGRDIDYFRKNLSPRYLLNIYYYCIISFFEFRNYEEALTWQQKFIQHKKASDFEELYLTMLIVSVILHYELGNYELAESLIKNARRYYRKMNFKNESAMVLLTFLRLLVNAGKEDYKKIYFELNEKLEILSKKETEIRFLNSFDFRKWVSNKLN